MRIRITTPNTPHIKQSELARRKDAEAMKYKKDLELLIVQSESNEASLRKRNQDALNELNDQLEMLSRSKTKFVQSSELN